MMSWIKKEISIFFTALMFYTRIPCPAWIDHSADILNKSTRYFPLVGWIVGVGSALVFYGAVQLFPISIAIILSMVTSILITGAFHEDGLADVCDGFGGGWTKERILTIMKDSAIGAYGAIGLIFILLSKYLLLVEIAKVHSVEKWVMVVFSAHALSRLMAIVMIFTHDYVRENEKSKAKPVAKKLSVLQLVIASFFALIPMLFFESWVIWLVIVPMCLAKSFMASYFKRWIGGYTGDCLGAIQQISEITFYLTFLVLWKFI